MKIDKEYPATHSMATAWYCVDEDGNVGVFDIEDNGPVPRKGAREEFIDDLLFDKFVKGDRSKIREIPLTKEQIKCLLHYKHKSKEQWRNNHGQWVNYDWVGLIVRIDMKKYYVLEEVRS